jgi:hypothetical protein
MTQINAAPAAQRSEPGPSTVTNLWTAGGVLVAVGIAL